MTKIARSSYHFSEAKNNLFNGISTVSGVTKYLPTFKGALGYIAAGLGITYAPIPGAYLSTKQPFKYVAEKALGGTYKDADSNKNIKFAGFVGLDKKVNNMYTSVTYKTGDNGNLVLDQDNNAIVDSATQKSVTKDDKIKSTSKFFNPMATKIVVDKDGSILGNLNEPTYQYTDATTRLTDITYKKAYASMILQETAKNAIAAFVVKQVVSNPVTFVTSTLDVIKSGAMTVGHVIAGVGTKVGETTGIYDYSFEVNEEKTLFGDHSDFNNSDLDA